MLSIGNKMNKQITKQYIMNHPNANKAALEKIGLPNLKNKLLIEFGIGKFVTQDMPRQKLVGLYRDLYLSNLNKVKWKN